MPLKIIGLNHNTAPIEIREQVVFAGDSVRTALKQLVALPTVTEAVILSTCNRTEMYLDASENGAIELSNWLKAEQNLGAELDGALFSLDHDDAIRHLFRVACGLDSMVLGEPQILGQLKDAFRDAEQDRHRGQDAHPAVSPHLFGGQKSPHGYRNRQQSGLSGLRSRQPRQPVLLRLRQHTAVLIGAGMTIELVAKHLSRKGIGRLFIANRDVSRAQNLASQFGGFALPLSELDGTLEEADILISSTAEP